MSEKYIPTEEEFAAFRRVFNYYQREDLRLVIEDIRDFTDDEEDIKTLDNITDEDMDWMIDDFDECHDYIYETEWNQWRYIVEKYLEDARKERELA